MSSYVEINGVRIDRIVAEQLPSIIKEVTKKDRDKHFVIDGRERSGKSKLARQLAKALDPGFNVDRIAFNANDFLKMIKDPARKKGDAIVLDEAFLAVSSRNALSDINRAMVGIATEMGQLNLFVIIVLPSYFDLDKYFAIWRCETLFHVFFDEDGDRGNYTIYPFHDKLQLYLRGKKTYNYNAWKSPYPPCRFPADDPINEEQYNEKKLKAFRKRPLSIMEKKWKQRTISFIRFLRNKGLEYDKIAEICGMKAVNLKKTIERDAQEQDKVTDIINNLSDDEELDGEEGNGEQQLQ